MPGEFDLNLELDVPAFLRRNEGKPQQAGQRGR